MKELNEESVISAKNEDNPLDHIKKHENSLRNEELQSIDNIGKNDSAEIADDESVEEFKQLRSQLGFFKDDLACSIKTFKDILQITADHPEKEIQALYLRFLNAYRSDARTRRAMPNETDFRTFLMYFEKMSFSELIEQHVNAIDLTPLAQEAVKGRKAWSDLVTLVDIRNAAESETAKKNIIDRLKYLGFEPAETYYENCIKFLQEKTVIAWSFNPPANGVAYFENRNIHQTNTKKPEYQLARTRYEKYLVGTIMQFFAEQKPALLPEGFTKILQEEFSNHNAAPRSAALRFDAPYITPISNLYGHSMIIFKEVVKHTGLYFYGDSLTSSRTNPATFHHLEILLQHFLDEDLKILASNVNKMLDGKQNFENFNYCDYIEVMIPGIELLSKNTVDTILIDRDTYILPKEELDKFRNNGIKINNALFPKYSIAMPNFDNIKDYIIELLEDVSWYCNTNSDFESWQDKILATLCLSTNAPYQQARDLMMLLNNLHAYVESKYKNMSRPILKPLVAADKRILYAIDSLAIYSENLPVSCQSVTEGQPPVEAEGFDEEEERSSGSGSESFNYGSEHDSEDPDASDDDAENLTYKKSRIS